MQCPWMFPHHDGRRAAFRCIREAGHEGVHRAYNGRWNAETQFQGAPPVEGDRPPQPPPGVSVEEQAAFRRKLAERFVATQHKSVEPTDKRGT